MAKPTAIVVWFDDNTRYHIDPALIQSLFTSDTAADACGHGGPHQIPAPGGPIRGPFADHQGPPPPPIANGSTHDMTADTATAMEGTCYYVNGVIVCP